jgi:hypothetical protein
MDCRRVRCEGILPGIVGVLIGVGTVLLGVEPYSMGLSPYSMGRARTPRKCRLTPWRIRVLLWAGPVLLGVKPYSSELAAYSMEVARTPWSYRRIPWRKRCSPPPIQRIPGGAAVLQVGIPHMVSRDLGAQTPKDYFHHVRSLEGRGCVRGATLNVQGSTFTDHFSFGRLYAAVFRG